MKKYIGLGALLFALSGVFFTPTPTFAQDKASIPFNLAVVDLDVVRTEAAAAKSIRDQIDAKRNAYQADIQKEEEALRTANQELARKRTLLAPEAFNEERRAFEQRVIAVQKTVQDRKQELQNAQNDALRTFQEALNKTVLEIARDNRFTLILRKEQTIVVADNYDITKQVIATLDKTLPTVSVFKAK